jgi:phage gp36-like protein
MAWSLITEAAVLDELNDAELETYRSKIRDSQVDPLAGIIGRATDYVRGFVGKQVPLTAAGLPPEVQDAAIDIIIYRLAKRVVTGSEAQRKGANDDAVKFLQGVAKGETVVSAPDSTAGAPTAPSVEDPVRTFKPSDQDGV